MVFENGIRADGLSSDVVKYRFIYTIYAQMSRVEYLSVHMIMVYYYMNDSRGSAQC